MLQAYMENAAETTGGGKAVGQLGVFQAAQLTHKQADDMGEEGSRVTDSVEKVNLL
jgi:hypothetical protein